MKDAKVHFLLCIIALLFTPRVLYEYVSNLHPSNISQQAAFLQKRQDDSNENATSGNGNTTYISDTLQLADTGVTLNVSTINPDNQNYLKTSGFKVLDFIQACYTPTNISVCGVNSPVVYLIDGHVGTPPQQFQSTIDINTYETFYSTCNTLTDCPVSKSQNLYACMYNSYDPNISFSFNYDNSSYVSNFVSSGSTTNIQGCWGWDNVTLGINGSQYENTVMDYFEFPTINANGGNIYFESILGLGLEPLISRNNFISDKQRAQYYNQYTTNYSNSLLDTLKTYGAINLKVYSMYVNEDGTGKLILGAVDKAKIGNGGKLTYFENLQYKYFDSSVVKMDTKSKFHLYRPFINIDYILTDGLNNYKAKQKQNIVYDAIIESTTRTIYGPKAYVASVAKNYGLTNYNNQYFMNCTTTGKPLEIVFSQGLNISIPWEDLKFKNLDPSTNKKQNRDCVFALNYKKNQDYFVLGQTFLNNVYFYSDIENNRYGIAPVNRVSDTVFEIQTVALSSA